MNLWLALMFILFSSIAHGASVSTMQAAAMSDQAAAFMFKPPASQRDVSSVSEEMASPSVQETNKRAVIGVRKTVVVVGKRDVSSVAEEMASPSIQETMKRAVAVFRKTGVVAVGKRAMSSVSETMSPVQEEEAKKRAVAFGRKTVVVAGKRDMSSVADETMSPVQAEEAEKRAVAFGRKTGVVAVGKRDSSLNVMRIVVSLVTGKIEWSYGLQQRISCNMKQRFGRLPEDLTIRLNDLHVLEAFEKSVEFLTLLSVKSSFENRFTFLDPESKEPVLWSIFSKDIAGKLGFFIQDEVCFKAIVTAVKDLKDSPIEFFLL